MSKRACLPTQTIGSVYESALNSHQILVEPDASFVWDRQDISLLARDILGRMLLGDIVAEKTWNDGTSDDSNDAYYIEVPTRLGTVAGTGSSWSLGLANALAAYAELARRSKLTIAPIAWRYASDFIAAVHRHHKKPQGWKFGIGAWAVVNDLDTLVGVVTVGRPVSAALQAEGAWEVTRMAVLEGGQNVCSALYAAAWRQAQARGCQRLVTYILPSESGGSLKAAGWTLVRRRSGGGSWSRKGRPRTDNAPTCTKQRWEKSL